jgi:NADPH:quinone reductase-like Zn-dependent oxidoreductase
MKAIYIKQYGDKEQLIIGELPKPSIEPHQVLIKVAAAGVNPVDFHVRNGMFKDTDMHKLPLILGWDAAGEITEIGSEVSQFAVGDKVFTFAPIAAQGAYAEFLAVDADYVSVKPNNLDMASSAAVPLAALTAWQGLMTEGKLQAGQRVLIHNASGGVGQFAVQMAKQAGAEVIATASSSKRDLVLSLGADTFIDYRKELFEDKATDVDLVFAAMGGNDILPRSLKTLKSGGRLVSTFDEIPHVEASALGIEFIRMWVKPSQHDLVILKDQLEQGLLRVKIDSIYPWEQVKLAHERSENQLAVGKIVLNIDPTQF